MSNIFKILFITTVLHAIQTANYIQAQDRYPAVADNPSWGAVTKLAFKAHDAKLAYGDDPNQFGLLWHPQSSYKNGTLVVLIHGGCWLSAYDIQHTYAAATAIAEVGFTVWSLEYRRTGETGGGWPTTYDDIKAGIKAIANLQEQGIEPKNVIVAGHSAGGHLALLAARDANSLFEEGVTTHFIGLAAITNIKSYAIGENGCQKAGAQFMADQPADNPEGYTQANPIEHSINPSVTLMHGEADPIVPLIQTTSFSSTNLDKITIPNAGHFDWVHPGTPAFSRFLDSLRTLTKN